MMSERKEEREGMRKKERELARLRKREKKM